MKRLIRTRHWYIDEFRNSIEQAKNHAGLRRAGIVGALIGAGLGLLTIWFSPVEHILTGLCAALIVLAVLAIQRMNRWARRANYLEACLMDMAGELRSRQRRFRADDYATGETLHAICEDWDMLALCFKERETSAGRVQYCCLEKQHTGGCVWTLI